MTANQLNMSWTVAPAKARRKSLTSVIWPIETSVFVTDVPMLAPITIGMARWTSRTKKKGPAGMMLYHKGGTCMLADVISIACFQLLWCSGTIKCFIESVLNLLSAATMLTTMEVLVDELWTRTVERTPIITPQMGLLRSSLLRNTSPAALPKQGVETLLRMVFLYCDVNISMNPR